MASSTIEPSTRTLDQPRGGVDWLRLLAGSLGEAVVAVDDGGALIAFNDGAARLFGVDPSFERPQRWDTLRGRLLAGSSGSCPDGEDPLATALHGTIRERREMFVRRADGSGTPVDVSSGPLKDADGRVVGGVAVLADATLRKNTEADIRRLRRAFHVFNVTSRELGRATCASQVYDAACRAAVEDGGFRMAWVGVVDEATHLVRVAAVAGHNAGYLDNIRISVDEWQDGRGPTGTALREGRHYICRDIEHDPCTVPWRDAALARGYRASAAFPLTRDGAVIGVHSVYASDAGSFGDEEVELLDTLASDMSLALESLRRSAEREVAEDRLREEARKLHSILDSVPEAVVVADADGRLIEFNEAAERLHGVGLSDAPPEGWGTRYGIFLPDGVTPCPPDDVPLLRAIRGDQPTNVELFVRRPDGSGCHVEVTGRPIRDRLGTVIGGVVAFADVTQRKRDDAVLRESEARLREAQRVAQIGNWEWDARTDKIVWSEEYYRVSGFDPAKAPPNYQEHLRAYTAESAARLDAAVTHTLQTGERYELELEYAESRGGTLWIAARGECLRDESGAIVGLRGTAQDITARKRAERIISEQARALDLYFNHSRTCLVLLDREFNFVRVNEAYARACGRATSEFVGRNHFGMYPSEDLRAEFERAAATGKPYHAAARPFTFPDDPSRRVSYWDLSLVPILDKNGAASTLVLSLDDVTDRKTADATQAHRAAIVQSSSDAIIGKDLQGTITSWNEGAVKTYGYSANDVIGRPITILAPPDRMAEAQRLSERVMAGEERVRVETVRVRKDGTLFDASLTLSPIRDLDGTLIGIATIARDITEQKRTEQELRSASRYARNLIEASLDPLVTINPAGQITDVNRATEEATGVARSQLIGTDFADYFTEPERAREGYRQVLARGVVRDYPLTIRHQSGSTTDVLYHATVYRNDAGELQGVFAAARDVTERKRSEELLRRERDFSAVVLDTVDSLVAVFDLDGRIVTFNNACELCTGYTFEEVVGRPFWDIFLPPEERQPVLDVWHNLRTTPMPSRFVNYWVAKDGSRRLIEWANATLKSAGGSIEYVMSTGTDITERRAAEDALRAASMYSRSLIEASSDPLVTISPDGKITDVNLATETATGRERQRLIGTDFADYFTEPARARAGYLQVLAQGSVHDFPLTIRSSDGRTTDVLYNAVVYRNEAGALQGVFAAARDVTERKRAEDEVRKLNQDLERRVTERTLELAASNRELEAFSYSVSHDLRAPLRAMHGFSQALAEDEAGKLDERGRDYLQRICNAAERMARLIDDVLQLSRVTRSVMQRSDVDLSALAHDIASDLQASDPARTVAWDIADGVMARGDPQLLRMVLGNLLGNAWKFSRKQPDARIHFGATVDADGVTYFVKDNGAGFDMAYAEKLFAPFQRMHSNQEFEGTGIGLATVQRIIRRHGGAVRAEAAVGLGASFYFTLGGVPQS